MKVSNMKKNQTIIILCALLCGTAFLSCSNPISLEVKEPAAGKATVIFGSRKGTVAVSSARLTEASVCVLEIVAKKTGDEESSVYHVDYNSSTGTYRSREFLFSPGDWNFIGKAMDQNGTVIFEGSTDITLAADTVNTVTFTLYEVSGDGSDPYVLDLSFGRPLEQGQFAAITGIAYDSAGHLYAADPYSRWIQEYSDDTGAAFIDGIGEPNGFSFNNIRQIASASDGSLWIADFDDNRVKHAVPGEGGKWVVSSVGGYGHGQGEVWNPRGIAVTADEDYRIFLADTDNHRIQVLDNNFNYISEWTTHLASEVQDSYPCSVALWKDTVTNPAVPETYVFVADAGNGSIKKFKADGTYITAATGKIEREIGYLACASDGTVFASDFDSNPENVFGRIVILDENLADITVYEVNGSSPGEIIGPSGLAVSPDGTTLAVADFHNSRWQTFIIDGTTKALTPEGQYGTKPATADQFIIPSSAAYDSDGNLYIVDCMLHVIKKYSSTGVYDKQWGDRATGFVGYTSSLAVFKSDGTDRVYALDNGLIRVFGTDGSPLGRFSTDGYTPPSSPTVNWFPSSFSIDSEGDFVIGSFNAEGIYKLNPGLTGMTWTNTLHDNPSFLWQKNTASLSMTAPVSTAIGLDGNYLVVDRDLDRVSIVQPDGTFVSTMGESGSNQGQFSSPQGICVDSLGNVYIGDSGNNRIQKFNASGEFMCVIGVGAFKGQIQSLAVKSAGQEIVAITNQAPYVYRFMKK